MTNDEKKEFLQRYKQIQDEIKQLLLEKEEILELATKITPSYSDMPHSGSNDDKMLTAVERIMQHDKKINSKIKELVETKENIEIVIYSIADATQQLLLRYRYINGWTWEHIAEDMHYDYRWVTRLHSKVLSQLTIKSPITPMI